MRASRKRPSWRTGRMRAPSARRPTASDSCSELVPHRAAVPLVKLLHAVFHRALVRADLVVATLQQRAAAGVHAQGDLVVLGAGFPVRGLFGFDELALERLNILGVVEL